MTSPCTVIALVFLTLLMFLICRCSLNSQVCGLDVCLALKFPSRLAKMPGTLGRVQDDKSNACL